MPQSLTEAFQGSDYTTVAHKHMYLHQSHTYTRTPPGCTRKRRRARGRSIYLLPYQASPHHSSHSIHPPGPTAALAELQGSQTVQTRPRGSRMSPRPSPAAAPAPPPLSNAWPHLHIRTAPQRLAPVQHGHAPAPTRQPAGLVTLPPPPKLSHTPRQPHLQRSRAHQTKPLRSPQTAMLARARDHLQRTRPPHELSFTPRPQGGTRPSWRRWAVLRAPFVPGSQHSALQPRIECCNVTLK
jgi:hypothetical protein